MTDALDTWCRDNGEHVTDNDGVLIEHRAEKDRWESVWAEAVNKAQEARERFDSARTVRARNEAAEDLEFWTNRKAFAWAAMPS